VLNFSAKIFKKIIISVPVLKNELRRGSKFEHRSLVNLAEIQPRLLSDTRGCGLTTLGRFRRLRQRCFDGLWQFVDWIRVARWYIFKPKIPIWVNFGGPWNLKGWYILWPFAIFYGHSVYFMVIGYIFTRFGTYVVSRYNMATLKQTTEILG
jgi:hypothetical protein